MKAASATSDATQRPDPARGRRTCTSTRPPRLGGLEPRRAAPGPRDHAARERDDGVQRRKPRRRPADSDRPARVGVEAGCLALRFGTEVPVPRAPGGPRGQQPSALMTARYATSTAPQPYKRYEPHPAAGAGAEGRRHRGRVGRAPRHPQRRRRPEGVACDTYASVLNRSRATRGYRRDSHRGHSDRHVAPPKTTQQSGRAARRLRRRLQARRGSANVLPPRDPRGGDVHRHAHRVARRRPTGTIDGEPEPGRDRHASAGAAGSAPRGGAARPGYADAAARRPLAPGEYVICQREPVSSPYFADCRRAAASSSRPARPADMLPQATTVARSLARVNPSASSSCRGRQRVDHVRIRLTPPRRPSRSPPATILTLSYASARTRPACGT